MTKCTGNPGVTRDALDTDLAIMVVTAPIWITGFVYLVIKGWLNDRCR